MDGQHRLPPVRECPRCHGVAALDPVAMRHWCPRCRDMVDRVGVVEALQPRDHRPPEYNVPDTTQRRWWRWLTTWGPRLAARVRRLL